MTADTQVMDDQVMDDVVGQLLRSLRRRLGLDVAFVSELDERRRVLRYVDSDLRDAPVAAGDADPAGQGYCRYVIDGQLPEFLPDPAAHPLSAALPVTAQLPVGTHLSVPIRFADGSVYGTLCCFALAVRAHLDERDLAALRLLADVVAGYLEAHEGRRRQRRQRRDRLRAITAGADLEMRFQPIVDLATHHVIGVEALARFPILGQPPAVVFADAWRHGVGVELELAAVRAALAQLPHLPQGAYLAVNAAPATLTAPAFACALQGAPAERLVVEVTEHAAVTDYAAMGAALRPLHRRGVKVAIDDAGTGFAGLVQILRLRPDIIKLDAELTRNLDTTPGQQAMITALTTYAAHTGTTLVAEGIETAAELDTLRQLGVPAGQGYHIGRPHPRPDAPLALHPPLAHTPRR